MTMVRLTRRTFLRLTAATAGALWLPGRARAADLTLGEFMLDPTGAILDGDTVKVFGLDSSLRLIGIDTEETFKNRADKVAARTDFDAYAKAKRGREPFPVKYGTEAGEEAAAFARKWFRGVQRVRLEYDEPLRKLDVFGRHLVHIFGLKKGRWYHYNVDCVRAGWSPYFMKYGYSERFHEAFEDAQEEAREDGLGIWGDAVEHYPDYDERLPWWTRRAEQLKHFKEAHGDDPRYVMLGVPGAFDRLIAAAGQSRIVFGTMTSDTPPDPLPHLRFFPHMERTSFSIVTMDKHQMDRLELEKHLGYYVYMDGIVTLYRGRPQFRAESIARVWTEPGWPLATDDDQDDDDDDREDDDDRDDDDRDDDRDADDREDDRPDGAQDDD